MKNFPSKKAFRIAVSDKSESKLGAGGTARSSTRIVYYFAEGDRHGKIFVQPLNGSFFPAGDKRFVSLEEFVESFKPEPLFFFNRVKPIMEEVQANLDKGERQLSEDRPDLAEKSFKKVLAVDEENIQGIFGLGMSYMAAGKKEDADIILKQLMGIEMAFDVEHTHLFNQFGIQMRKTGMLAQALDYYQKALDLCGEDEHLHFNLCRIHYELGDLKAAVDCISKALSLNKEFPEGLMMLAHLRKAVSGKDGPAAAPAAGGTDLGLDLDGAQWGGRSRAGTNGG